MELSIFKPCYRRNGFIHMEKIDTVLDSIFDDHPFGVALDQFWSRTFELIGYKTQDGFDNKEGSESFVCGK